MHYQSHYLQDQVGDVKANILILLDTSESMVNKPFGGAAYMSQEI